MQKQNRFSYRNLDELQSEIARRDLDLPVSENVSILGTPVRYGTLTVPNRFVAQPMEGCDCSETGQPGELTLRKYRRFGAGGAGMIWFEACAVVEEGKANPRQLWIHEGSVAAIREMVEQTRKAARESMDHDPVCVLQLTHSGRYSRPFGKPRPVLAHHDAVLDPKHNLPPDYPLITDKELDALQNAYVKAAHLAADAGFDAVDIKSCHRYLLSGLLAAHTRENSKYGGSFENRTRMIRETVQKVRNAVGDRVEVTSRINAFDAIEYPYGWGVDKNDKMKPDLSEPIQLFKQLKKLGFGGINITIGNPYFNPHVNRPADKMIVGWEDPGENPLDGVARIIHVARDVQKAIPDLPVVGSGYSWLRQYTPYFTAAIIENGWASLCGLGRGVLAYPDFARDVLTTGKMDPKKVCIACSGCTQIMRDGGQSGCVVRDSKVYGPILREGRRKAKEQG